MCTVKTGIPTFLRVVDGSFLVNDSSVDVPHLNREPWILVETQPVFLAFEGEFYLIQIADHL